MPVSFRPLWLAGTLLLGACAAQRTPPPPAAAYPWFPFKWYGERIEGKQFDQLAILVPVTVSGLRGQFVAQFDLGSSSTFLYENALRSYFPTRRQLYAHVDTTRRGQTDTGNFHYPTTGLALGFGAAQVPRPRLLAGYGDPVPADSLYTRSDKSVGTIGGDFLAGKVLVIDYPQHRMCVLDSVDAYWRRRTSFVAARVKANRMHIPLTIDQQTVWALFDTGASLFPLCTDEARWRSLAAPGPPADTLLVNSWGQRVPYYNSPLRTPVYLGAQQLPPAPVWFTRDARQLAFFKEEQVAALAGNAFFTQRVIVFDFLHQRFGVAAQ